MRRRGGGIALLGALALVGCAREDATKSAADPSAIASDGQGAKPERYVVAIQNDAEDFAGDYVADKDIRIDNWRLKHVVVRENSAFRDWMMSSQKTAASAPILLVFEDAEGALNAKGEPRRLTLVPASFAFTPSNFNIEAVSGGVGALSYEGEWQTFGQSLTGTLKTKNQTYEGLTLKK